MRTKEQLRKYQKGWMRRWRSIPENREKSYRQSKAYYWSHRERILFNKKKRMGKVYEICSREKMKPCMDCGVQYNPWIMQFDHRDPKEKEFTISHGNSRFLPEGVILKEIKKCDVVCANCHFDRTYKRRLEGVYK
jgi:hypothetical protein